MSLRVFFFSVFGREMLEAGSWSIDSLLIVYNLDFLNSICLALLLSARFAEKYYLCRKGALYKKACENSIANQKTISII